MLIFFGNKNECVGTSSHCAILTFVREKVKGAIPEHPRRAPAPRNFLRGIPENLSDFRSENRVFLLKYPESPLVLGAAPGYFGKVALFFRDTAENQSGVPGSFF